MKSILAIGLTGTALLVFCLGAPGMANTATPSQNSFFATREVPAQGGDFRTSVFAQVKHHLEQVRAAGLSRGNDDFRLNNSIAGLNDLQTKFQQHMYDDAALRRTIDALARVASFNRMPERNRKMINEDIHRLRLYRQNHADWYYEHAPQES